MRVLDGIWALRYKGVVVNNLDGAIFGHSLKTYGWIWLVVGVVLVVSGLLLMGSTDRGAQISRWIGIVAAGLGALTAVSWLPYYPVWSLVYIGLGVAVIYGLATQFEESPAGA
jgi:hypothetical protein